jgi:hypothetical protein
MKVFSSKITWAPIIYKTEKDFAELIKAAAMQWFFCGLS